MQDLPGPRKVLVLEDDRRTMYWLVTAATRTDRIEVVWARTLEEAIDALRFYDDQLSSIVLADTITDGTTVEFARHVQQSEFSGLKIRTSWDPSIDKALQRAGFQHWCNKFDLPSYLLFLETYGFRQWASPPTSPN